MNVRDGFRLAAGFLQANRIFGQIKPDVLFSKGGFVVVPSILAARLRTIPIVTHDSDTVTGLANRLAGKRVAAHATGMPVELHKYPPGRTHFVGVPIDEHHHTRATSEELSRYAKANKLPNDRFILLVAGGSLGADALNKNLPLIANRLFDALPNLFIVHIAGSKFEESTRLAYKAALGLESRDRLKVLGFSDQFYQLVSLADLVITRAGATAIAEMAACGKASIVVPSPFLAAGHQLENAKWLRSHEAAELLDNDASPDEWLKTIVSLAADANRRKQLADNIGRLAKKNAASDLAKLIVDVATKAG